jgi:predicted RNA-binding Zn-ribbon protein involved in translation (DUF1610 family)
MERSETRTCVTCGGSMTSPKSFLTSDAVKWLVANGWRLTPHSDGAKYYCAACGLPEEKKPEAKMEDIF